MPTDDITRHPDILLAIITMQQQIMSTGSDLGQVMQLVVDNTLSLTHADGVVIELAEDDDMVYRAAAGMAIPFLGLRLPKRSSLSGSCVASGQPIYCPNATIDPRVNQEAVAKTGICSMITHPLIFQSTVVGVLKIMSRSCHAFRRNEMQLLALLSVSISASMYFAERLDHAQLLYKATHDDLTQLANRALFMEKAQEALRSGQPFVFMMIDINGLKQINDDLGHQAGDTAIKAFAHQMASQLPPETLFARLGGDEFVVLLQQLPSRFTWHNLEAYARFLQQQLGSAHYQGHSIALHASIGIARYPQDADNIAELMAIADQRMYADKQHFYQHILNHTP